MTFGMLLRVVEDGEDIPGININPLENNDSDEGDDHHYDEASDTE